MDSDKFTLQQVIDAIKTINDENIEVATNRDKNSFIFEHNILFEDIVKCLKSLTKNNYIDGPRNNYDSSNKHPIWIFKSIVKTYNCYIKLFLCNKGRKVFVISFHEFI